VQKPVTDPSGALYCEDDRTAVSKDALKRAILDNLFYVLGKFPALATTNDYYLAVAHWISTASTYTREGSRTVAYLSAEFLMGPYLDNNLINLGIRETIGDALEDLGLDLEALINHEPEPGLGNGGLGRLAACYIDSMATLEIPALGYGIRYEHGIFHQELVDGWQVEKTDKWLSGGNPWELPRPEWSVQVKLGGHTEQYTDDQGRFRTHWVPDRTVLGVPFDSPILGYRNQTANTLRLWKSEAEESFDFATFNRGDYYGAVLSKVASENLTKVLYPNDESIQGKQLRLEQQFFFVSCSLQDMLRILQRQNLPLAGFHEKFTVQLNDTHPAVSVAELMRLLIDEHAMAWDEAWGITTRAMAYTNHTLLPEALERWPLELFKSVLPRHLEIIYEINARFLDEVRIRFFGDDDRLRRMSLIDESGDRYVRMAHLACVGAYAINGVAELHSQLLKEGVLKDFYDLWPHKFTNVTNGVTPRRWIVQSNPRLTSLVTRKIGDNWIDHLEELHQLEPLADDAGFRDEWRAIKLANKQRFAEIIAQKTGVIVDPSSMFDVQVKRIHEYKRQHLNILNVIAQYHRLKSGIQTDLVPRTYIFGGKAAPGYYMAKLIIRLITAVADVVNRDPHVGDLIKVVFLPNFNVTNGHKIYPAADLSEQISTAGKEASGTGNMKFQMNGALTIGTLDGANVEIREQVGDENFFLFGLTTEQVQATKAAGYRPMDIYESQADLKAVLDLISSGFFSRGDLEQFKPLIDNLLFHDPYLVLADFEAYMACQDKVSAAWKDPEQWARMSIINAARSGKFSSDRSISDYVNNIWKSDPVPINLLSTAEDALDAMQMQ